jgi:hypothetical protein
VGAGGFSPPGPVGRASANVEQSTSQRDPQSEEPEAPGSAVLIPVRLDALPLPIEGLMVKACIVHAALIPWPLVPLPLIAAILIWVPLIWVPLISKLATVATVSTVILSAVTAVVALAVLCPTRLPRVGRCGAGSDAQREGGYAQCTGDRGLGHEFLGVHCAAPWFRDADFKIVVTNPKSGTGYL